MNRLVNNMRGALLFLALLGVAGFGRAVELPDFTQLVEKHGPAVVNISTTQKIATTGTPYFNLPDLPDYNQFGELFRRFFEQHGLQPDFFDAQSLGSGFIVSEDGYILTNAHVVNDADEILVRLQDRRELTAEVIGTDAQSDLALLKIEANNLPVVKLGSSKDLKVGEWVMAIGNPFGFDHTVTAGIVSAKGRSFQDENYVPFIQTDVAINPGNSGGPLFNIRGEVVGINARITSGPGQRSYIGLSFAIPIDVAKNVMEQLKSTGHVSRGWLGVMIQDVTPELSRTFGLDRPRGALVAKVLDGGPAESGGIQVGDVILQFNGRDIEVSSDLPPVVGSVQAGKLVNVIVMRQGNKRNIRMKLGELPDKPEKIARSEMRRDKGSRASRLGLVLKDIDSKTRKETGAEHGVVVIEVEKGPAANIGLRPGDIIQVIDNQQVENVAQFNKVVKSLKPGSSVAILVYRKSGPVFLAMRIPE